jgi:hypothetical protein
MPRVEKENEWSAGPYRDGAGLVGHEVRGRVELVGPRPAGDRRVVCAARRAADRVPRAADRDVLAERDGDVRVVRDVHGAVRRRRRSDGRCGVAARRSELLRVARLRADEVSRVVVGVLGPTDALVGLVAVHCRHPCDSRALAALGAAHPVAADAVDHGRCVREGDARSGAVGEARPVGRVSGDRAGVAAGRVVVHEEVVLAGREDDPRRHGRPCRCGAGRGRAALKAPARNVHRGCAGVDQLDELVVAADRPAKPKLRDDDTVGRGEGRCSSTQDGEHQKT